MRHITQNTPKFYLERAEEARARAGEMHDPEGRRIMLGIAESYKCLARYTREQAAENLARLLKGGEEQ